MTFILISIAIYAGMLASAAFMVWMLAFWMPAQWAQWDREDNGPREAPGDPDWDRAESDGWNGS
jgi:hypothetical protein